MQRTTGKRCNHCNGNIVTTYDNIAKDRNICIQCGREEGHKCENCNYIKEN